SLVGLRHSGACHSFTTLLTPICCTRSPSCFAWITVGSAVFAVTHKPDGYGLGLAGIYIQRGWVWSYCCIRSAAGLLRSSGGTSNGGGVICKLAFADLPCPLFYDTTH